MFRLFETCAAATNWPQFLKPFAASFIFVPAGNSAFKRASSCGFFTGRVVSVVVTTGPVTVVVVVPDVVVEAVVVVAAVVFVVGAVVTGVFFA